MGVERLSLSSDLETKFAAIPEGGSKVFIKPEGREGILVTLRAMRFFVEKEKENPEFIRWVHNLLKDIPARDKLAEAKKIYQFVKENFRYEKDPFGIEMVIRPFRNLKEFRGSDCDCQATFVAACLEVIGIPTRFVAIKTKKQPNKFSHVYTEALINRKWIPIDTASTITGFGDEYKGITEKMYFPEYKETALSYISDIVNGLFDDIENIKEFIMNTVNVEFPSLKEQANKELITNILKKNVSLLNSLSNETNLGLLLLIIFGLFYFLKKK